MTNARSTLHDRTGRVDAILYGKIIEALDDETKRLDELVSAPRFDFIRCDGRIDGLALAVSLLAGGDPDEIRGAAAARVRAS